MHSHMRSSIAAWRHERTGRDVKLSAADERPTRVRDPGRDGSGATLLEIESARDVKRSVCFAGNDHQQSNGQAQQGGDGDHQ